MYGTTAFISLLLLGCVSYYVMAQEEGTGGGIEIEYEDGPNVTSRSVAPIFPTCSTRVGNIRVTRNFRSSNGRFQVCVGVIQRVQHCAGSCHSSFVQDPLTLRPVKRCACCKPTAQGVSRRNFPVTLTCRPGNPSVRTVRVNLVEARGCGCRGC